MTRVLRRAAIVLAAISAAGVLASYLLNVFAFDSYDSYGEVKVPGTGTVHLPQGPATVSFHALTPSAGGSYVIPRLSFGITSPDGVADPTIVEDTGGYTTINADAHARVWRMDVAQAGDYRIQTAGDVSAFISPRLAFGRSSPYGWLPWAFAAVCLGSILVIAVSGLARVGHTFGSTKIVESAPGTSGATFNPTSVGSPTPVDTPAVQAFVPSAPPAPSAPSGAHDVLERLESLARLRASGDLTPEEFEAAKKRVLGG